MWKNFDPKPFDRHELASYISSLDFSHWRRKDGAPGRPQFIVLHNTSSPDIKTWLKWSPETRWGYVKTNAQAYYEKLGWQAGPHFFVPPSDAITAYRFSNPETAGTHCSCFNSDSIGIEMVGEFDVEPFDTGPGATVRDNAVYLLALLHLKLNLNPGDYSYAKHGLHFHVECKKDNHDCPGRLVSKQDIIDRVTAEMAKIKGSTPKDSPPTPEPMPEPVPAPVDVLFKASGKMSTFGGPKDLGMTSTEGLALFADPSDFIRAGMSDYLLSSQKAGAYGLGRRLNPDLPYVACRWDYNITPRAVLRACHIRVTNTRTGKVEMARAVDWGPNADTKRAADLSPGLAKALGLDTDDVCTIEVLAK